MFPLLAALLLVSAFAKAQNDPKAKALLADVSEQVKTYDNVVIDFKYAINNEENGLSQETRGDVTLEGEKYVMNLMGATQMYDGKKLYVISNEDEEVTISTVAPGDDDAITPSKMLTFFNKGYTYKWDIVQNSKGRKIQYVKLIPIDSKSEFKQALLGIDSQTKNIYKLILTQNNGTRITITVNGFKTNQPLAKNTFTFDESRYEGYYINRLD
ncbi:outer membrane lipoprotein carrier protein LolA [Flavobacteriaceae bacterium YJPT1-3]|nr:outer membrane lipoprotein carrier protein LolA [Flavobacteriaceae bacterium YJPT1-3]